MNTLFLGMNGAYTWAVLNALLQADVAVAAVLIDAPAVLDAPETHQPYVPLHPPPAADPLLALTSDGNYVTANVVNTAWSNNVPVFAVHDLAAPATKAWLASFNADVACVACFSRRLASLLLRLPRHGFLNVHPSWLPCYRGPAPRFWQLRDGVDPLGVTVHWMNAALDAGPIVAQAHVALPTGIDGHGADRLLGQQGGALLVQALSALGRGEATGQPQGAGGSRQPWPQRADFVVDTEGSARRAFNFMRGTVDFGVPYQVPLPGGPALHLRRAACYTNDEQLGNLYTIDGADVRIQCTPGVLDAVLDASVPMA